MMALFKLVDAKLFVFCFLKTQCLKDDVYKKKNKKKNVMIKKTKLKNTDGRKKERVMRSLHIFLLINNTIEITLPSPDDAIDTQMFLIVHRSTPMHRCLEHFVQ